MFQRQGFNGGGGQQRYWWRTGRIAQRAEVSRETAETSNRAKARVVQRAKNQDGRLEARVGGIKARQRGYKGREEAGKGKRDDLLDPSKISHRGSS